jgi:hypothetical protein
LHKQPDNEQKNKSDPGMDQSYFEYHKIVESFILGKLTDNTGLETDSHDNGGLTGCPDSQRRHRMKLAFINALREEMVV